MKHIGCNNEEALWVVFFDLEKAGFVVELRFCSSLGLLQSQTSDDAVGPAEPPPVAKSDTGLATVPKQTCEENDLNTHERLL